MKSSSYQRCARAVRPVTRAIGAAPPCAVLVATLALAACQIGPKYQRPADKPPATWITPPDATGTIWPVAAWWENFGSPQLNAYIAQAQLANFDIAAALERINQADAQVRIGGAALLPSLSAGGTVERSKSGPSPSVGATAKSPAVSTSQATLTASYELDFWGKNRSALEAAKAAALASRYDRETVALTVTASVADTYFQILALHDQIGVIEENIRIGVDVLNALETEQRVGTGSALDVAQQSAAVSALRAQLPPLRLQLQQSIDALAILLARKPEEMAVGAGTLADLKEPAVAPGIPSELLARRPDVAQAEAQLVQANANIRVARAAYFPSISLTANGGVVSTALNSLFGPGGLIYALSTSVTQPIFQGGALEGQVDLAQARYNELLQDYRKSIVAAFGDVEDALVAVQETALQVKQQQDAVDKARRAYEISIAELRVGTSTLLAVLTTENALFPAEETLVQAKLAHYQAIVSLFRALGGGWQLPAAPPPN